MLKPDSTFYLAVNYFIKSEGELKSEGSKWCKSQPMGVNKLNSLMKEMTETAGISVKTNHSGGETLVQRLQDNDVPPNHIVQITGHKNLLSINNYSSLRERQIKNISKILSSSSSTMNAVLPAVQLSLKSHFTEAHSSTSAAESPLQTMFQGNYITGGVFNINLAATKNTIKSPELGPKAKKKRSVIESNSSGGSQE